MAGEDIFGDEDSSDEEEKEEKPKDVEMKDAETKKPEKSAFDSDDDDDDSDGKAAKEPAKPDDASKKDKEKDPFAEGDSDDDSDAKKKTEDKKKERDSDDDDGLVVKKTSPKKDGEGKKADDDELEDSDDDEPEFDDTGAVTGTSHSKGFQKKASRKSALDTLREQEEAEEAEARAATAEEEAPAKPLPPKVDPRTMVVLEPERPPSSTSLHITKLPNLIGIQPEAFDEATYSAKAEEEEYSGFVHDMIRWRYKKDSHGKMMRDDDGKLIRESNTRLVQWEDGSYTLHVGKEALVVDSIDSSQKIGPVDVVTGRTVTFAGLNGYLYLSQHATFREPRKEGEDDGDDGEGEFNETAAGTVLECMGAVGSRMLARPSSLRSEAHKSLTVAVRKKTIKRAQIAEIVTQYDPEKMKEERIKQQDGMAKEKARKKNYGDGYRSRARPRMGMNRDYLDDDDFDSTNLRAIKKRTMNAEEDDYDDGFIDYGDEDDDDDGGTFNRKPRKRTKNRLDDSDDEEEAPAAASASGKAAEESKNDDDDDDDEDEDDDDEVVTPVKSSKKRSHQAVFDDDDSD